MEKIDYAYRAQVATLDANRELFLVCALEYAHELMNNKKASARMRAKAHDIINTPEAYKDRFAWSVASIIKEETLDNLTDTGIREAVEDVFDAMAGEGLD